MDPLVLLHRVAAMDQNASQWIPNQNLQIALTKYSASDEPESGLAANVFPLATAMPSEVTRQIHEPVQANPVFYNSRDQVSYGVSLSSQARIGNVPQSTIAQHLSQTLAGDKGFKDTSSHTSHHQVSCHAPSSSQEVHISDIMSQPQLSVQKKKSLARQKKSGPAQNSSSLAVQIGDIMKPSPAKKRRVAQKKKKTGPAEHLSQTISGTAEALKTSQELTASQISHLLASQVLSPAATFSLSQTTGRISNTVFAELPTSQNSQDKVSNLQPDINDGIRQSEKYAKINSGVSSASCPSQIVTSVNAPPSGPAFLLQSMCGANVLTTSKELTTSQKRQDQVSSLADLFASQSSSEAQADTSAVVTLSQSHAKMNDLSGAGSPSHLTTLVTDSLHFPPNLGQSGAQAFKTSSQSSQDQVSPLDVTPKNNSISLQGGMCTGQEVGNISVNEDLKRQVMACLLDPTFHTFVSQVEKVMLELEDSVADNIRALEFLAY